MYILLVCNCAFGTGADSGGTVLGFSVEGMFSRAPLTGLCVYRILALLEGGALGSLSYPLWQVGPYISMTAFVDMDSYFVPLLELTW